MFTEVSNNALLIKNNDALVSVENVPVTEENLNEIWDKYFQYNFNLPDLTLTVLRDGEKVILQGKLYKGRTDVKNYLAPMDAISKAQQTNLEKLIKG